MKLLTQTILFCLLAGPVFAQTKKEPSLQDMQRQLQEMQRQLFQQFQQLAPDNQAFSMPDWKWDTTFSFRIDTLDGGNGIEQHFFFSPFGQDSTFLHNFGDFNPFSDGFNPFGDGFQRRLPPDSGFPGNEENSALGDHDDGLLPEERLRKDAEKRDKPTEKQTAPESKKSKIKTIRI